MRLAVAVATKLNRTHLLPGEVTYLLPCLGRIDVDEQATGPQAVSMEDSTACIHGSRGQRTPVSDHLLSEPKIVAEMAKATLAPNAKIDWDAWVADYAKVREAIEKTYPQYFKDFNKRLFEPGGFPRPLGARRREWQTPTGKANFTVPESLSNRVEEKPDVFQLITLRADGQFNTTIYAEEDRFRGIYESRKVVLMNAKDIGRAGLATGDTVTLETEADDGVKRGARRPPNRGLRHSRKMHRRLLPRMQRPAAPLALCRGQQGARGEVDPGAIIRDFSPEIVDAHEIPITTLE